MREDGRHESVACNEPRMNCLAPKHRTLGLQKGAPPSPPPHKNVGTQFTMTLSDARNKGSAF